MPLSNIFSTLRDHANKRFKRSVCVLLYFITAALNIIWSCVKARTFSLYLTSNQRLWFGGFLPISKYQIYSLLPKEHIPQTYFFPANSTADEVQRLMQRESIVFPIIMKPDCGRRSKNVHKVDDNQGLIDYISRFNEALILQSYVNYPIELGLFYHRFPNSQTGEISSLAILHFSPDPSPKNHASQGQTSHPLSERPVKRQNASQFITPRLTAYFDKLAEQIPGFYYGRFDILCHSFAELAEGKRFKILELNGLYSIQRHIFDPDYGLWQAQKDVWRGMDALANIARMNAKRGVPQPFWFERLYALKKLPDIVSAFRG